jgi:hypothetical protein
MLEETAENYKSIGKNDNYIENKCVIADTGYFSEENLTTAQEKDIVICPAGQVLPPAHGAVRKLKNYSYKTYHASNRKSHAGVIIRFR